MLRRSSAVALVGAAALAAILATPQVASAATMKAVEYPVPVAVGSVTVLTAGPDGAVWFTEKQAATIGRINARGVVREYAIPPPIPGLPSPQVVGITRGPDGALWFASEAPFAGRVTTAGAFSWFPLSSGVIWVAVGPDGNLWYTELNGSIARVTTAGGVTEFPAPPSGSLPGAITAGPDGAMWFTESYAMTIGRITTAGVYSEFHLFHPAYNSCIAAGLNGNVWFAEGGYLAEITSTGVEKEHPAPSIGGAGCLAAKGSAMWFTTGNGIGRMSANGAVTTFTSPSGAGSSSLCVALDGHLWSLDGAATVARWVRGP